MLIDLTNKVAYSEISENVVSFFVGNGNEVALTKRALNYGENHELNISSFTDDEKIAGINALIGAMSVEQISEYVKNIKDLTSKRVAKIGEIKAKFEASLVDNGGLEINGLGVVNAGEKHLKNCQDMLKIIGKNEIDFRLYDNSFIKVNKAKLEQIEVALIQAGLAGYAKKWELELAVKNAKNQAEIDAIKVEL